MTIADIGENDDNGDNDENFSKLNLNIYDNGKFLT